MKLVCPQEMTQKQAKALGLCLAASDAACAKEEMAQAIERQTAAIEAGVVIVDRAFPVPRARAIDLFGVDAKDRPVLIFVDEVLSAEAVCSACLSADWVEENIEAVAHIIPRGHLSREVRIWHLAGEVQPGAQAMMRRMKDAETALFLCRRMSLAGEAWFVVQPLRPLASPPRRQSFESLLTEEEIGEFFEAPHPEGEEVTGSASLVM